jgi:hypothetical protein
VRVRRCTINASMPTPASPRYLHSLSIVSDMVVNSA